MKKILIGILAAVAMVGCKIDNSDHPHVDMNQAKPATIMPMSVSQIALRENMADAKIAFNWAPADYGYLAAVDYVVEADVKGGDFSQPVEIATSSTTSGVVLASKLNSLLVSKLKFEPANPGEPDIIYQMDIRVASSISKRIDKLYSETYSIYVTTYKTVIIVPSLGVPGSYVPPGGGDNNWSPANPLTRVWSLGSDKKYTGYINMTGGSAAMEFKFVDGTTWDDPAFVSPDPTLVGGSYEGTFEDGRGGNIGGVLAGYYRITVDLTTTPGTFNMFEIKSLGIVGDATPNGWDNTNPTMLTYNGSTGVWELKNVVMTAGELLILANKSWDYKFAISSGKLTWASGDNIPSPGPGTYDLTVDLKGAEITYEFVAK